MLNPETYILLMLFVQIAHSFEEITQGFAEQWFFIRLNERAFLIFEIVHNVFWTLIFLIPSIPYQKELLSFFALLMFANSIEHIVWAMWKKKYVPGLITALLHLILFIAYFYAISANV